MTATKIDTEIGNNTLLEEARDWAPQDAPLDMPQQILERQRRANLLPRLFRRGLSGKPV